MTRRGRQAALSIALLMEEFTANELADALKILGSTNKDNLPSFLLRSTTTDYDTEVVRLSQRPKKREGEPKFRMLEDIRQSEPEKYEILNAFASQVRKGGVLVRLEDIRQFGASLAKDFKPGRSRRDAVGRLLSILMGMNVKGIRNALDKVSYASVREDSFQRLANQIISGSSTGPARP